MKRIWLKIFFIYVVHLSSFLLDYSFLYRNDETANILDWIDPAYTVQFLVVGIIGCVWICRQPLKEFSGNILKLESLLILLINVIFIVAVTQIGELLGGYEVDWIGVVNRSVYCLIFVAVTEEWIYRGFITTQLQKVLTKKSVIVVISAVMFSAMHLPSFLLHTENITVLSVGYRLLIPFLMGLAYAVIYLRKRNLFVLIVIHGVYDLIDCVTFGSWYFVSYGIYWGLILAYMALTAKNLRGKKEYGTC